jgi:hypothetical protein
MKEQLVVKIHFFFFNHQLNILSYGKNDELSILMHISESKQLFLSA